MLKIIKYLRPHFFVVIVIIALMIIQAACDLSLPQYTSDIVDVGIQQGGIEDGMPKALRKTQIDKLELFMSEEEKTELDEAYGLIDVQKLTADERAQYIKEYPIVEEQELYELKETNKDKLDRLQSSAAGPIMLVTFLSGDTDQAKELKEKLMEPMTDAMGDKLPEDYDLFDLLGQMPAEQRLEMRRQVEEQTGGMSDSILSQMAIAFTRSEYEAIGINVDQIRTGFLLESGAKMLGVSLLIMLTMIVAGFLAAKTAAKVGLELRTKVFRKVVSFSNAEIDKFSTASLITRSTNDIQQIQMVTVMLLRIVIYAPIIGIGGAIKVLNNNTSMAWIIFVAVAAILCLVSVLFAVAMPKFKKMQTLVDKVNLVMREILTGLPVIRAFSTVKYEEKRFDKANWELTGTMLFTNRAMTFMMPMMMMVMNCVMVLIIWFGAKGIDMGNLQVGDMIAFMTYTMQIVMAFLMITMISIMLPRAAVAAGRIEEIVCTDITVLDPRTENKEEAKDRKGVVEFDHVSFRYPNAGEDVLQDISFTAKPGETTAFIGSTGSGKSTLVNLIPRFYDVTGGRVCIGGVDVKDMTQHELREKLGFVPQKGILFSGTIASNLRYGRENATQEEVEMAASIAQAAEFIDEKQERYDAEIAQGGTNVSGGQKQRLSIARAIAKKPEIFIFDDSFSALDYKTDITLRKALKEKTKESTVLIVAQRISTILHAEQIIVLDDGRIAGIGTHEELLAGNEVYRQIAMSQLSEQELTTGGAANE